MKSFRLVSLFTTLLILLAAAQSNPVARANQSNVLPEAQGLPVAATAQMPAVSQKPPVKFAQPVVYDTGGFFPGSVAIGDLNGDGHPDLVVANECQSYENCNGGEVTVLLGNGDGTFQSPVSYGSGGYTAGSVAIADVNGDGKLDLVVSNYCQSYCSGGSGMGGVSVLLGNGDGTFQPAVSYSSGGADATSVAIADLNGDGKPDIVVANKCQTPTTCNNGVVGVLLGNGDGTFQSPVSYSSGSPAALSVAIGDVNGDGFPDIVVANNFGPVALLLGNGNGTFQPPVNTSVIGYSVALGDVNGDRKLDLAVSQLHGVSILLGNGNGTFQSPITYTSHAWMGTAVAIGDVNGDGKPDLVVTYDCSNDSCKPGYGEISVLSGNGDGTFNPVFATVVGGHYAASVAIGDVNGDGKPDIVELNQCALTEGQKMCQATATGSVGVLLNELTIKTTTKVESSLNPSQVNQSVTFTATITSNPSIPNGEIVTFYNGTTKIGTSTSSNGVASLATSFSAAGKYTIKASYPGDVFHEASSGMVKQVVNP
jgi:hypothetical protein